MRTLKAATTHDNVASQKVLTEAGFLPAGPAEPAGRPGTWYQRDLAADRRSVADDVWQLQVGDFPRYVRG